MSERAGSPSGMSAIIIGATGAVGKQLLAALLDAQTYTSVHAFGRRPTGVTHSKLTEHTLDFEKLYEEAQNNSDGEESKKLSEVGADSIFITLGTTRAQAGSAAKFERIDREYVLAAAKAALETSKTGQQLLYCSSAGSTSSSPFLYPKSKGLTEEGLANLSYPQTFLFRPGMLQNPQREQERLMERVAEVFVKGILNRITDNAGMDVKDVAKSMLNASRIGAESVKQHDLGSAPQGKGFNPFEGRSVTAFTNSEMKKLAALP
ncbi:hypothetical protein K437DRAFT_236506 [Tilletiaria anomala UBC 951]|uniref:NAD-dependent epimerase/dehydratase domain-containing protein n=1 Tax=Tilletiaria anomala (strain ATCC 24038 / CBS 436.72 / UBC 951) TaxID=1037660 RepID=A0A066VS11_TILAU|nr:uncharacterized protein K437DRAFT_236506 [Tilletiaria anomala UBC 951]KDN44512.1 hypothetical protein K437DRAFT_236506 [Tilletiaria anomala UBC 951]